MANFTTLLRLADQAKKRDELQLSFSEEELDEREQSLLGSTVDYGISGLAGLGHVLDIPGQLVRSVAIGQPGRFLPGLFNPEMAVRGEEVQEAAGMAPGFWSGMGVEVAMDPLTYLTGGITAITKMAGKSGKIGKALYRSGVLRKADDLVAAGVKKSESMLSRARFGIEGKAMPGLTDPLDMVELSSTVARDRHNIDALDAFIQGSDKFTDLERANSKEWLGFALGRQEFKGGVLGPRRLRKMMTAEDMIKHSPDPDMAGKLFGGQLANDGLIPLADEATDLGRIMSESPDLGRVMSEEALGPHMAFGIGPLQAPINVPGLDKMMDKLGSFARWSWPGRKIAQLGAKVGMMGAMSREVQEIAPGIMALQDAEVTLLSKEVQRLVTDAKGLSKAVSPADLRKVVELKSGPRDRAFDEFMETLRVSGATDNDFKIIGNIRQTSDIVFRESLERMRASGIPVGDLDDDMVKYFPRQAVMKVWSDLGAVADPTKFEQMIVGDLHWAGVSETAIHRSSVLREVEHGTETIREILMDDDLSKMITDLNKGNYAENMRALETLVQERYGHKLKNGFIGEWDAANGKWIGTDDWVAEADQFKYSSGTNPHAVRFAQWMKNLSPDQRNVGLFGNDLFADMEWATRQATNASVMNEQATAIIGRVARNKRALTGTEWAKGKHSTVREVLDSLGINTNLLDEEGNFLRDHKGNLLPTTHLNRLGHTIRTRIAPTRATLAKHADESLDTMEIKNLLDETLVPKHVADDLVRMKAAYALPEELSPMMKFLDSHLTLTKAHLTSPFAGFAGRNFLSGQMRNKYMGLWSARSLGMADSLMAGSVVDGSAKIKQVSKELKRRGIDVTDEHASDLLREWVYVHDLIPDRAVGYDQVELAGASMGQGSQALTSMTDAPGLMRTQGRPGLQTQARPGKRTFADYFSGLMNPAEVQGAMPWRRAEGQWFPRPQWGKVAQETKIGPVKAGIEVNRYIEGHNRIAPWLEGMMKGWDDAAIARRVKDGQVDYSHRNYSAFERNILQRVFPFYKFRAGQFKWLPGHLEASPGGGIAQTIRGLNLARGDEWAPEWIQAGAAAQLPDSGPLSSGKPEDNKYLTGMGFMFEDPIGMLGSPKTFGLRTLSAMRPEIKVPLEIAADQLFFQGGRPLGDTKSVSQSLLKNLQGVHPRDRSPEEMRLQSMGALEHLLLNSPASRYLTTANQLTSPLPSLHEGEAGDILPALAQTTTGMGIHTVFENVQDAIKRERVAEKLESTGKAKSFERTYVPLERIARTEMEEGRGAAEELLILQAALNRLAKKGQARRDEYMLERFGSEEAVEEYAKMLRERIAKLKQERGIP